MWMCFISNALTYIALNVLEILMPYVDSISIYSIMLEYTQYLMVMLKDP